MDMFRLRRFFGFQPVELAVQGADFKLRLMSPDDYKSWQEVRLRNRDFLQPFEPTWSPDGLTRSGYLTQVRTAQYEYTHGLGAMMLMIDLNTNGVIGGINLRNVRRGVAQMGTLGYWLGEEWSGQGRMTRAVSRMVEFGFTTGRLHRVEAACIPENEASARVLERAGFTEEGYAKGYLRINGRWRDHRLFAIVAPESAT